MAHEISRTELYELIWSEPMTKIAKRLGISDVGLAKACRRANIPVPNRGYWVKTQHGKTVTRPLLPPAKSGQPEVVVIAPPEPRPPRPEVELPAEIKEAIEAETHPEHQITVPKTLGRPHPIIGSWLDEDRRLAAPSRTGGPDFSSMRRHAGAIEKRKLRILNTLFKALEKRGFTLKIQQGNIYDIRVEIGNERIDFSLSERQRQVRIALTEEEKRSPFNLTLGRDWKQVRKPTGELVFRLRHLSGHNIQSEWRDTPNCPLEEQLNRIVVGFIVAGEIERQLRTKRLEERRRYEELERQRWEAECARQAEQKRVQALLQEVSAWRQALEIRAYVNAVLTASKGGDSSDSIPNLTQWSIWARKKADEIDQLARRIQNHTEMDD